MAARTAWTGTLSMRFPGVPTPIPVGLRVYSATTSPSSQSFKQIDPDDHQPLKQQLVNSSGEVVPRAAVRKGVEVDKDTYVPMTEEGLDLIASLGRSTTIEVHSFPATTTIPLELSNGVFDIVPADEDIARQAAQMLWNGLRHSGRAAIIEGWAPKANSRPRTLVIVATPTGLRGHTMPFAGELKRDAPEWAPAASDQVAEMFATAMEAEYSVDDFQLDAFEDGWALRRAAAIELATGDTPLPKKPDVQPTVSAVPDLMATLAAAVKTVQEKAPAPKKPAAKKARAKVTA